MTKPNKNPSLQDAELDFVPRGGGSRNMRDDAAKGLDNQRRVERSNKLREDRRAKREELLNRGRAKITSSGENHDESVQNRPQGEAPEKDDTAQQDKYTVQLMWSDPVNFVDLLNNVDVNQCISECDPNVNARGVESSEEDIQREYDECLIKCTSEATIKKGDTVIGYIIKDEKNQSNDDEEDDDDENSSSDDEEDDDDENSGNDDEEDDDVEGSNSAGDSLKGLRNRIFTSLKVNGERRGGVNEENFDQNEIVVGSITIDDDPTTLINKIWEKASEVKLKDLIRLNGEDNSEKICESIGRATKQNLKSLDYMVNGESNPMYVQATCINKHAVTDLVNTLEGNQFSLNLLRDEDYRTFCKEYGPKYRGQLPKGILPEGSANHDHEWQICNPGEDPPPPFSLLSSQQSSEWKVNEKTRDRIKKDIKERVNSCFTSKGCSDLFALDVSGNFSDESNSHVCCKKFSTDIVEEIKRIDDSKLSDEQKNNMKIKLKEDKKEVDKKLKSMKNLDESTANFLNAFMISAKGFLKGKLESYFDLCVRLYDMVDGKDDEELENKMGEKIESFLEMSKNLIKKSFGLLFKGLKAATKTLFKLIGFLLKSGFRLVTWILEHPRMVQFLLMVGLAFKEEVCRILSIKAMGKREEISYFQKAGESAEQMGIYLKKFLLESSWQTINGTSFQNILIDLKGEITKGLAFVLTATGTALTGGLLDPTYAGPAYYYVSSVITEISVSSLQKSVLFSLQTMMLRESFNDLDKILTGSCIKPVKEATWGATAKTVYEWWFDPQKSYWADAPPEPPNPNATTANVTTAPPSDGSLLTTLPGPEGQGEEKHPSQGGFMSGLGLGLGSQTVGLGSRLALGLSRYAAGVPHR